MKRREIHLVVTLSLWFAVNSGLVGILAQELPTKMLVGFPILLRNRTEAGALDEKQANAFASRYTGFAQAQVAAVAAVFFTDEDYPFLKMKEVPVWLITYRGLMIAPEPGHWPDGRPRPTLELPNLYVVIEARTRSFIEAFTPPKSPWWEAYAIGGKNEKYLAEGGVRYDEPASAPKVSLRRLLSLVDTSPDAPQLVIRLIKYTDQGSGIGVNRIEARDIIPVNIQRPVWIHIQEGMKLYTGGPLGASRQIVARIETIVDANSGEIITTHSYAVKK